MEQNSKETRTYSRRNFLKGMSFGIVGTLAVSAVIGKFLPSYRRRGQNIQFDEDSIFSPAKDRYPKA
jgi:hypothetical protein